MLENRAALDEPRNYYDYVAKHHPRVYQDKFAAIRPRPKIKKAAKPLTDEERAFVEDLKALSAQELAAKLGRLIKRIFSWETVIPQKSNPVIQTMIDEAKARIVNPKNYESMFHGFRARLEQMLDEGYSV